MLKRFKKWWSSRQPAAPLAPQNPLDAASLHKKEGDAFFEQSQPDKAIASYYEAIALNPGFAEAYNNLGGVYRSGNNNEEAERFFRRAISLKPGLANAHYNLAVLLVDQRRFDEAIEAFDHTLKHNPGHLAALTLRLHLERKNCQWRNFDADVAALREGLHIDSPAPESVVSPFVFLTLPGTSLAEQQACAAKWARFEYGVPKPRTTVPARTAGAPISLGYLSADFHDHATARLLVRVLEHHDRDRFRIVAYSYGHDDRSAMRKRLVNTFNAFHDISGLSDAAAARQIQADHIDLLVDLKGYTENSRSGILALRPAPIQVNYLGYPGTLGATFADYLIADDVIVPPEHEVYYTEKILRLPHCYQPTDDTRPRPCAPTRDTCGLPKDGIVFCCFNHTYKITPEIFTLWCRLLKAIPGSVLWLLASAPRAGENLRREAQARGVNPERLVMAPFTGSEQHLARLPCADLFLDTIPYNAHTTCSDALWMGIPVVTCMGHSMVSRVAASLLTAMQIPELIARDLEGYFALALDLATNGSRLEALRQKIAHKRDTSPLFDSRRYAGGLEAVYLDLVERHMVS